MKISHGLNPQLSHVILSLFLVGIIFTGLFFGANIVVPILLSLLFAILLQPIVVYMESKIHLPHVLSVFLSLCIFIILIAAIFFFITREVASFTKDLPLIKENLNQHANSVQQWIKNRFDISYYQQKQYINSAKQETITNNKDLLGSTLGSFSQALLSTTLVPIYTFLILLYKSLFMEFLRKKITAPNHFVLQKILFEIKTVVRSYIFGLLIEMLFVAILTSTGFWILGIKYFIFLGLITALLNLIPYIGILIAGTISVIISLTTSPDLNDVIGVVCVNIIVQLIDNNLLVPNIVGSKVSLNALATIIGVIIGGALAGVAGMFLAIPFLAIIKIIMDNIPEIEPWGYLLGNEYPGKNKGGLLKKFRKKGK